VEVKLLTTMDTIHRLSIIKHYNGSDLIEKIYEVYIIGIGNYCW